MWLDCVKAPPRTDIVFLNVRAEALLAKNVNTNLNNKIIIQKWTPAKIRRARRKRNLLKRYPGSVVIGGGAHTRPWGYPGKHWYTYLGSYAMNVLLKFGANVTYGGADFYYEGFGIGSNYPPGYDFGDMNNALPGEEDVIHKMKNDLYWIKNTLMVRYPGKLTMHEKTEYYFRKSLERYRIQ